MSVFKINFVLISMTVSHFIATASGHGMGEMSLTSQMNRYCGAYTESSRSQFTRVSRIGKAGPRGPPGAVNYTKIYEMIEENVKSKCGHMKHHDCSQFDSSTPALAATDKGGVFEICSRKSGRRMKVNCDLTTDGGGWMVFQKRINGRLNFTRKWVEYVMGFGTPEEEYWMGLEKLHRLTSEGEFELRIDLEDWEGNTAFAQYSTFIVGSASTKYQLNVTGYSGNAGDSLDYHHTMKFSTIDEDNDNSGNCAAFWKSGGWWFDSCFYANLNGVYVIGGKAPKKFLGTMWYHWKGSTHSLKSTEMKFRPKY